MKNTKYAVIPDKENPNYWILCCFEKNFKLSVHRSYAWTMDQSLYHYEFFHLQDADQDRIVSYEDYEYYAFKKGISLKDNDEAATWFIKEHLGYLDLAYCFEWLDHQVGEHYKDESKPGEPFDTDRFFIDDVIVDTTLKLKQ